MKIVFFSIGSYPYVSDWGYQDNGFTKAAIRCGDEPIEISTSYVPGFLKPFIEETEDYKKPVFVDEFVVKIYRLQYRWPWLPRVINLRLRAYSGVKEILEQEKPDMIFVHDMQAWSMFEIADYLRAHPECAACADTHATYRNSARNFISNLISRILDKFIVRKNIDVFSKMFYLCPDMITYFKNEYGIELPQEKLEFLPLGDFIVPPEERGPIRREVFRELSLPEDAVMVVHSGKMVKEKRTKDLLEAVKKADCENLHLVIIGKLAPDVEQDVMQQIQANPNVHFLGWKTASELRRYLIACDLYAQPGTESSTVNTAMCCGCAIMLSPQGEGSYKTFISDDTAFYIETVDDMVKVLRTVAEQPEVLQEHRNKVYQCACDLLDYDKQIERIKAAGQKRA